MFAKVHAGVAQLVERNLAKVEVESSRLFSRSKFEMGSLGFPFLSVHTGLTLRQSLGTHRRFAPRRIQRRDSKSVMQRIANPSSPVRLRVAPPNICFESSTWTPRLTEASSLVASTFAAMRFGATASIAGAHMARTAHAPEYGSRH